jgi:hypothetical protein
MCMEDSLLSTLALCAFPTLACLLAQLLFPSFIMNDDAVIRTSIREIVTYRQLPGGRRVLTRVVGWRYSIHVRRSPAFKRRQRTLKQRPARGNKRRPLLQRLKAAAPAPSARGCHTLALLTSASLFDLYSVTPYHPA